MIKLKLKINIILFISFFIISDTSWAQNKNVPMMSSTKQGVHIIVRGRYPGYSGFKVYRKETGFGKDYKLLTEEPIREVNEIAKAQEILGTNWDYLKDFLDTQDPNKILLRMKSPDAATILRYCGVPFAEVLGRYYFDDSAEWGEKYVYKLVLLSVTDRELHTVEVKYKVDDELPQHTTEMTHEQRKDRIKLKWDAPKYKENAEDDFVGFNLYRSYKNKTKRLNFLPVLRRDKIIWFDRTVKEERTYDYLIKPVDVLGREGETSAQLSVYVKDLIPPLVPQGLTSEEGYQYTLLKWDQGEAKDIVNYDIFRAEQLHASYSKIDNVDGSTTRYIDSTVIGGKPYYYKIQAIDNVGNESLISTARYAVAKDSTAPPPPKNLDFEITEDNKSVILNWQKPSSVDMQGYFVSRGYRSNQTVKLTHKSITETKYIDKDNFHAGHTYYYYVAAIDLSFNQSQKARIKVQIPDDEPPLAPKNCTRSKTEQGYVQVRWQPSMSLDVKAYNIYRTLKGEKKLLTVSDGDPYYILDSTMTKGKQYVYSVVAVDSFDNQSEEVQSPPITPRDILPPPEPESINIEIEENGVSLSWDCREVSDLKGFNIYRSNSKYGSMKKINRELVKDKKYFDTDGKKGEYYKITSFDTSKNETASKICIAK